MDHLGRHRRVLTQRLVEFALQVDPVEREDDVGLLEDVGNRGRGPETRLDRMQRMLGRERSRGLHVGEHDCAERFRKFDPRLPVFLAAGHPAHQDDGLFGIDQ